MSDSLAVLRDALQRRASSPVGPAPVREMLDRAHSQRRTRRSVTVVLSAALVALVLLAAVDIAGSFSAAKPTVPAARLTGPSAQQIADGSWSKVTPVPTSIAQCISQVLSTSFGVLAVLSDGPKTCQDGVALYDLQTGQWRRLAAPPSQLRLDGGWQAAWTGSRAIIIDDWGHDAELNPATNRWTMLDPPEILKGALVVADPQLAVVMNDSQAMRLDGSTWTRLPSLPVSGSAAAYVQGTSIWAFLTANDPSGHETAHLYRLDGDRWERQPQPTLPVTVDTAQSFGPQQLIAGQDCPLGSFCGIGIDPDPQLIRLGTTRTTTLHMTPFGRDMASALVTGRVISGIQGGEGFGGQDFGPDAEGAVAAYDPASRTWYPAPRLRHLTRLYDDVWTRQGLIIIGTFAPSCHCDASPVGLAILRPAS